MTATPTAPPGKTLTVHISGHNPAPQGSKAYKGHYTNPRTGKRTARLVEQSARVAPWRQVAALHTRQAVAQARLTAPLDGLLRAELVFTMQPAKNVRPGDWPNTRHYGDIDKLIRSTFDALATGGAIADDARIIDTRAVKTFPGRPGALDAPGAIVRLTVLSPDGTPRP